MTLVVLGFTLNPDSSIPPILEQRLNCALDKYHIGTKIVVCGRGTPEKFLKEKGAKKTEARAMADYLLSKGVSEKDVLLEEKSTSTLTNAFYSYVNCLSKLESRSIKVITNQFHISSAKYCFNLVYGSNYDIEYFACTDEGLDKNDLEVWKNRIQRMVLEAYPILFNSVETGDTQKITTIIEQANSSDPTPNQLRFEKKLAEISGLKDPEQLRGVI